MTERPRHAIVFGAAGLLGWSVLDQLLAAHPGPGSFSRVTAVVHRPASEADLCLPPPSPQRPALRIVAGIDLQQGTAHDLARQLEDSVPDAGRITHVFYFVFSAFNDDHVRECEINCGMMQRVADAVDALAPELESFVYSGGTRVNPFSFPTAESRGSGLTRGFYLLPRGTAYTCPAARSRLR
ncbi:hypothetical protein CDD83_5497 [Cordyceps sp. RAO-2017]|nr:hypothetical protein CDD83_5497 [Cordyceps sp. RAO-2017]